MAYERLAAEVEARNLPGDKPPVRIMVLAGSEADMRAGMNERAIEPVELDEGADDRALPPGDPPADA